MPKISWARSLSLEKSRITPYPVNQNCTELCNDVNSLESAQNVKEWEQARCPICIEHPHNAILLRCSSHERGCRPYMCNNSYRHSNCFEQFCKFYGPIPLITELKEIHFTRVVSHRQMVECPPAVQNGLGKNQLASKLICPLCRGSIYGYMVVEPARQYMNSKVRSCSSEVCNFSGTYSELRKHARSEHPDVRPSKVDPVRCNDWVRWERERDFEDVLSLVQSDYAIDNDEESFTSMLDALRDLESLQGRMENVHRGLNLNFSFGEGNDLSLETRPYSQHTRRRDFRSSHHMPHAIQLHGQNQWQRAVESTSTSQSRQLHWRSQASFDRHRRSFESTSHTPEPRRQHGSTYKSGPRASRLRWRNQRWSSLSSNHNER